MLSSLRAHRNFRLFFAGQLVSYCGTWMQDTALAWAVLQLTHSPFHVGLLMFFRYGPFMVGGLYGGVVADRFDNRGVLMCSQTVALCAAAGLAAVAFAGVDALWLVYLLATLSGVALVFDSPSKNALIYQLVGREALPNAISLNIGLQNTAKVIGPAVGGVLIATVGAGWCFAINAASFVATLGALAAMRPAEFTPVVRQVGQGGVHALREGFAYASASRLLRVILAMGLVIGFFGSSVVRTLLAPFVRHTLHGGPRAFGLLFAAYGAGAVAGALAAAARGRTSPRLLAGGALIFSAPIAALALVDTAAPAALLLFFVGVGWTAWGTQANAQVQLAAPDHLRGRLISLYTYAVMASAPLGSLAVGWLAGVSGASVAFAVSGTVGILAALGAGAALRDRPSVRGTPALSEEGAG